MLWDIFWILFNLNFITLSESSKYMANKLKNDEKWVYKFTKPTIMKFQPKKDF